ncbi:MAG: hypothetical protein AAF570_24945 [Bacteroidota bacterium]
MNSKNFDKVFFFTYSPSSMVGQQTGALSLDFSDINEQYDIVDLKQSYQEKGNKVVVTIFARLKAG